MGRAAVFLDRDGVLDVPVGTGRAERPPWTLSELVIVEGAAEALGRLRRAGFLLVAVTNQPDIARGRLAAAEVDSIDEALSTALGLDAVYVCPHGGTPPCPCRKPAPGMLLQAAADLGIDLTHSWLVGDRWVDIAAGEAGGVRTVLLERPTSWAPTSAGPPPASLVPGAVVPDLNAAVDVMLEE